MQEQKLLVTMKDIQRHDVLKNLLEGRLTGREASDLLAISYVHLSRLKKKFVEGGLEGILRKSPSKPPNQKIPLQDVQEIIRLRKDLYYDFNIMHFKDKLEENHSMKYSYESIRQMLIRNNLHQAKKKKKIYRQRRRMPKAGMLVQMDSSLHNWLPDVDEKWYLIAMIDDATNEIPYAAFFPRDTTFANMSVIRHFIEIKGLFYALYVDRASHFVTTRLGGLHYNVSEEQQDAQIQRALKELGISLIPANSPQAKGRIEVTFRLFQDRLVKEMRLAGIKDYESANKFLLQNFLPYYNAKFTHAAESAYMRLPADVNLDLIFCIKLTRTVKNDNTIQVHGQTIQIPPNKIHLSFVQRKVQVCIREDNQISVLFDGKTIAQSKLSKEIVREQKQNEALLNKKVYVPVSDIFTVDLKKKTARPSKDHPWNKKIKADIALLASRKALTFQNGKCLTF